MEGIAFARRVSSAGSGECRAGPWAQLDSCGPFQDPGCYYEESDFGLRTPSLAQLPPRLRGDCGGDFAAPPQQGGARPRAAGGGACGYDRAGALQRWQRQRAAAAARAATEALRQRGGAVPRPPAAAAPRPPRLSSDGWSDGKPPRLSLDGWSDVAGGRADGGLHAHQRRRAAAARQHAQAQPRADQGHQPGFEPAAAGVGGRNIDGGCAWAFAESAAAGSPGYGLETDEAGKLRLETALCSERQRYARARRAGGAPPCWPHLPGWHCDAAAAAGGGEVGGEGSAPVSVSGARERSATCVLPPCWPHVAMRASARVPAGHPIASAWRRPSTH